MHIVMYKILRASKSNYVKHLCLVVPLVPPNALIW